MTRMSFLPPTSTSSPASNTISRTASLFDLRSYHWFWVGRKHMANTSEQAYAFTCVTPILPGREPTLQARLADMPTGAASPLARMGCTHFARWVVLHDLVYQGPPQVRDRLQSPYLFFISNFDGELDAYLDALLDHMAGEAEAVWSCCVGFPGTEDRDAFMAYLKHNQLNTTFFFSAYPDATVDDVGASLAVRQQITDFAIGAQALDARSLRQAWLRAFPEVGACPPWRSISALSKACWC